MILYHGSNVEVKNPRIIANKKGRDFGPAFYLTAIKEQAERHAIRKCKQERSGKPIVSVFDWDENICTLNYKEFDRADENWLDLIIKCRMETSYVHGFDIVVGKIADDTVGQTILYVLEGIMRKDDAIKRLEFQKINSQHAFCTERSLNGLLFKRSYEVKK